MKAIHLKSGYLCCIFMACLIGCSSSSNTEDPVLEDVTQSNEPPAFTGVFVEAAHPTSGTVTINSALTKLNLANFKSDPGPILEFYLATDLDATDYITLGELKGLEGDFTYDLPDNLNFENHKYLMVWCVEFSVNFGHAILTMPEN